MWCPTFHRDLHDEKIQMFTSLMLLLDGYFVVPEGQDSHVWIPDCKGLISIKSF